MRRDLCTRLTARADGVRTRLQANQRAIDRSIQLIDDAASRYDWERASGLVPEEGRRASR
jgi:hypothetical protein